MAQKSSKRKFSMDITQDAPTNKTLRRATSQESASPNLRASNNQFLDKITAIWKTTSSSAKNSLSCEGQDVKAQIREDEDKYVQGSQIIQSCQKELETSENNVSELRIAFEKKIAQNHNLKEKYAGALELSESFTQNVSYVNNILTRCNNHAEILEKMNKDVVLKLREDKDFLTKKNELNQMIMNKKKESNVHSEQIKLELVELKINGKAIQNDLLQQKEEIKEVMSKLQTNGENIERIKICENESKSIIGELEKNWVEKEKETSEQKSSIEESKIKELKECYEKKLALYDEELNKAKPLMNSIQKQKEEILQKFRQKEKLIDESENNFQQYSLEIVHVTTELNKVTLARQQSNYEKVSFEEIMNEVYQDYSIKINKFDSMTQENNNLTNDLKILNDEFEEVKEETKQLNDELETREIELKKAIQSSNNLDKEVLNYQESKDSKEAKLQKELEFIKESMKSLLKDIKEVKLYKRKLEREFKKKSKMQADKTDECLSNLKRVSSLNDKTKKELTASKKNLRSLEIDDQKLKEEYAKWQKAVESKFKNTEKVLVTNNSEKQLKEKISQFKANLKELEKKRQQLKTEAIKTGAQQRSLLNVKQTHETLSKSMSVYQLQDQSTKGAKIRVLGNKVVEKKIKSILKPQANLKSPKSPRRKLKFSEPLSANSKKNPNHFAGLSIEEEYEKLSQKTVSSPRFQLSASQGSCSTPASPATPTQKKFFKSRGTS